MSMMEFDKDENAKESTKIRMSSNKSEIALQGKISEIFKIW